MKEQCLVCVLLIDSFERLSNKYKNGGMVNNYSNSCIYVVVILKNLLILLKIVSNIVFDFSHTYWLNY